LPDTKRVFLQGEAIETSQLMVNLDFLKLAQTLVFVPSMRE